MPYSPPFHITSSMANSVGEICERLGRWFATVDPAEIFELRNQNRIIKIQASLAIENNSLSVKQVQKILLGKEVPGLPGEIQEVRNANAAYEKIAHFNPARVNDLLATHALLMEGLIDRPGQIRTGNV